MDPGRRLDELLPLVQKPPRYLGNEWNAVHKDHQAAAVRAVLAFPDLYEVGMSNLGLQLLYEAVNRQPGMLLERAFAPATDMEELMRRHEVPLFALESRRPVREFDLLGFSLQYELSYTNVLNMLDLAGIPLHSERRQEGPLVIGGGPCAFNPEPLAPFFDLFMLGDGEVALPALLRALARLKKEGADRRETIAALAALPGVYVPSFYLPVYRDGVLQKIEPLHLAAPPQVSKNIVADLNSAPYPTRPLVPYIAAIHDRAVLELFRGCSRGCRFCQAGVIYRPVRRRSRSKLKELACEILRSTGYEEISLASLSSSDYPAMDSLLRELAAALPGDKVKYSLPSLRIDSFSVSQADLLRQGKRGNLTFAPEVASPRLRRVIKKNISEEALFGTIADAVKAGWRSFKLYFMIGLPTEEEEDVLAIAGLCRELASRFRGISGGRLRLSASVATFVPKAHTPFQWEPQLSQEEVKARQRLLSQSFRQIRGGGLSWHDAETGFLEAVFARGDRLLSTVLEQAWRKGCRFDSWSEHFSLQRWQEAFREAGLEPEAYAYRRFGYGDPLPWDHLGSGAGKDFLIQEHRLAMAESKKRLPEEAAPVKRGGD